MSLLPRALAILSLVAPSAVLAGDLGTTTTEPAPVYQAVPAATPDLIFTVRGGASVAPDYFGSGDYSVGPDFALGLNFLRLPGGRSFGSADANDPRYGLGLRGSFRYIGKREAADHAELRGLNDVDASVELGLGLGYTSRNFDAFADLRYGVVGHESFVGELGADVKFHPTDRLSLSIGPRVFVGSDDYAQTYFGVSAAEAGAAGSNFAGRAFNADGGVLSAGIELGATYKIDDNWGVEGAVTWDRFTGDAADSPIVRQGDRDQYGVRIGITRRITLDF
ncbi:MipA/OmpV family protein [Oceaniglobus trochenteri]|uniref:MipA/OmpV family protein n=1 Tax=Oceaniglobus trochenteri TaxID=2763260 RepID=UPI001D000D32|nr:MipA/OmpV family protein [Oceaniglobus trochenteri]